MSNMLPVKFCKYILIFSVTSSLSSFASEIDSKIIKIYDEDFVHEINKNSIPYSEIDSPINQFTDFFGLKSDDENDEKINYKDLSITIDSKNTRNLYYKKLENMTIKKSKDTNFFYLDNL